MSATNASKRLGFGLLGAVLASGLLLAACAVPEGRAHDGDTGEAVSRHPGAVADHHPLPDRPDRRGTP
ncbi:hypothetical protein OS965_11855 [Streptomyces sp. H27-G5]|uniref:hypothetical protein n=1 Tax=Streptomyces sp. H27-G5 TaxID=2996698 RepID=UPI002270BEC8|nr:hypothetical protein [Streptomyces sp. H27-G5]MCY0918867.1 hypothetical protein [Streptomyces sp. H27-G5]